MENVFYEGKVMWSQIDSNNHLRHSAYADFGAQARLEVLSKLGFDADKLEELKIGPILFREELIYMREIRPNDIIKVTCAMSQCRADGSRWSFTQSIFRSDGIQAAQINTQGAWLNIDTRKLVALPQEWLNKFMEVPKTIDFVMEAIKVKVEQPIVIKENMTELETNFEAAKKRVLGLTEKPSNEKMLELYSLNKQATIGDINADKPAMFDFVAAAKYNAWNAKIGISKNDAMQQYIDFVNALFK